MREFLINVKRISISFALIMAIVLSALVFNVEEAQAATALSNVSIVCYTTSSSNVTTYTTSSLSTKSGYICSDDKCTILQVYSNGAVRVKYPISGGKYKTAYASASYFFTNVNFSTSTSQLGKKLTAYRKSTGSSTIGSVYASDNVMIIGQANSRTQVMYPVSGSNSWKLGWVSGSYGSSSSTSSTSQTATALSNISIVCYTTSGSNVTTYTTSSLSTKSGYISSSDKCTILQVYSNGAVQVKYPISGGKYKTAYASSRYFFTNVNFSTSTSQLGKKLTAYRKSTGSSTIGSVYASDNVMIIGQANSRTQVMYPVSGSNSWKLGWVSGSYGSSNTSSSSSSSMLSSPVPSGCKFSRKTNDNGWTGYHDINKNVSSSTPVYAIADGTVTYKQAYRTYNGVKYLTSYGNFILFTSSDGKYTAKYCHLSSFNGVSQKISSSKTKQVSGSAGTYTLTTKTVKKGDVLGYIGKTGNASGIHLHFELYQNGSRIDPTSVISGLN